MDKGEEQDDPTVFKIMKDDPDITYNEATEVQKDLRLKKEGVCITGALKKDLSQGKEVDYHRYWKDMYEREHKLRQEAQGETTIVKGIGMNSPEMKDLQARVKELDNSLSIALEINEKHQRYNGKLQVRVGELEKDNRLLSKQISDYIKKHEDSFRKAGL